MKHLLLAWKDLFSKKTLFAPLAAFLLVGASAALFPLSAHAGLLEDAAGFIGGVGIGAVTSPITIVMWIIFKVTSLLLGFAGIIFNWTVLVVVFEFSKYFGNSPGMTLAWGILRDFANIGLLFGFVFMGIATILDLHKYPWKQALPKLVIYAVLLNFSLFATEAIIDATNVVSATLYKQTYAESQQCTNANWLGCVINTGLAAVVLDRIQLSSVYAPNDFVTDTVSGIGDQFTRPVENILKYVLLSLVTTVAAVVLFGAASMLISRGVTLAFLMVTSPLGFAGLAIPFLEGMARKWWKKLIDQALFAPVFILLLLASLKMTDGLDQLINGKTLVAALSLQNVGDTTGVLIFFTLTMGFMVASLAMAQQFGIYGSDAVMKGALDVIGRVGGAPLGTAGWVGRRTLGSASLAAASGIRNSRVGKIPILGSTLAGIADRGARASYDIRGKSSGLGQASAAAQGGRVGEIKDGKEREVAYNKSLADADKDKYSKAKYEAELLKKKIQAGAPGATPGAFKQYLKERKKIVSTTEYRTVQEKEKKEKFDAEIKDWNDAGARLKEASANLARVTRELDSEQVRSQEIAAKITEHQNNLNAAATPAQVAQLQRDLAAAVAANATPAQVTLLQNNLAAATASLAKVGEISQKLSAEQAKAVQNRRRINDLSTEQTRHAGEASTATTEQQQLETSISNLGHEIVGLRQTITKQQTQYRRNVEKLREPNVQGLSVVDRDALRDAAMSMRGAETAFKNLNAELSKGLKANLSARGLNIPNP